MLKHCLDCYRLSPNSRCALCALAHDRALSTSGRQRRGKGWTALSLNLRTFWASQGRTCIDAYDGRCRGRIQADHVVPGSTIEGYAPRCAYHNNRKGNRNAR